MSVLYDSAEQHIILLMCAFLTESTKDSLASIEARLFSWSSSKTRHVRGCQINGGKNVTVKGCRFEAASRERCNSQHDSRDSRETGVSILLYLRRAQSYDCDCECDLHRHDNDGGKICPAHRPPFKRRK